MKNVFSRFDILFTVDRVACITVMQRFEARLASHELSTWYANPSDTSAGSVDGSDRRIFHIGRWTEPTRHPIIPSSTDARGRNVAGSTPPDIRSLTPSFGCICTTAQHPPTGVAYELAQRHRQHRQHHQHRHHRHSFNTFHSNKFVFPNASRRRIRSGESCDLRSRLYTVACRFMYVALLSWLIDNS